MRVVPTLQTLESYYQAIEAIQSQHFEDASSHLQRLIHTIEAKHPNDHLAHTVASTLYAKSLVLQGQSPQAEAALSEIITRLGSTYDTNRTDLYTQACLNLLIQYIHSNVSEAVKFGRKMLTPEFWKLLSVDSHADWHFLIGVMSM